MIVRIEVKCIPPWKQLPAGASERRNQKSRKEKLQEEAKKKVSDLHGSLITGDLRMKVVYIRSKGRADATNILGGIADSLQKIVYENDKFLTKIDYSEVKGNADEYVVEISSIERDR